MTLSSNDIDLIKRLNSHPKLKARMESILDLTENSEGNVIKADEAERQTIETMRQLGNEVLQDWGNRRSSASDAELRAQEKGIEGNGKKK